MKTTTTVLIYTWTVHKVWFLQLRKQPTLRTNVAAYGAKTSDALFVFVKEFYSKLKLCNKHCNTKCMFDPLRFYNKYIGNEIKFNKFENNRSIRASFCFLNSSVSFN